MGGQGSHKVSQLVHPYRIFPTLGLHINRVQSEPIFIDHAINAAITGSFGDGTGFGAGTAVTHGQQEIDHELFKEARRFDFNPFQKLGREISPQNGVAIGD